MPDDTPRGPPRALSAMNQTDGGAERNAVEYDRATESYRASFDSSTDSVCMAVLSTVATVADVDPIDLPSLHSVVDPDALETMMEPAVDAPSRGDVRVSFTLDGHDVTVHGCGVVTVRAPNEADD